MRKCTPETCSPRFGYIEDCEFYDSGNCTATKAAKHKIKYISNGNCECGNFCDECKGSDCELVKQVIKENDIEAYRSLYEMV